MDMKAENTKKSAVDTKTIIAVALFVVLFGGMLALATIFDLQIDKILACLEPGQYLTTNFFGRTFEIIGSWPIYIMLSVAFAIIFANTMRSENKVVKILCSVLSNIVTVVWCYVLVTDTINYINQHFEVEGFTKTVFAKVIFVFISIAVAELIILPFTKMDNETLKALLKFSFVIIFAAALSQLTVTLVKEFVNRPRFRTMNALGDSEFSAFSPWYVVHDKWVISDKLAAINVGNDGYRSFPSGHTCAAGMSYAILALPHILNKYNNKKSTATLYIISILITGIVAVSRMVCGAHFFSDVLVGGTITFLCVMLGIKIFIKKDIQRA